MIAIACDSAAFDLKNKVIDFLKNKGCEVKDFGAFSLEPSDYPDFALPAARAVASGECKSGILICGTGIGMSIVANKVRGIRCAHVCDLFSARATREHNDANMLALGSRILDEETALKIIELFLATPFSTEERHVRRVEKIFKIDANLF